MLLHGPRSPLLVSARTALSLNSNDCFQVRSLARAAGYMVSDFSGKEYRIGARSDPAFFLDCDSGSIRESDMHAPDCAAGPTQESHKGTVAGPQLRATYNYHRADHVWILRPNPTCV